MIARFWWGSNSDRRKMSWVSWKKLTKPKRYGGLGFRELHKFNQALLSFYNSQTVFFTNYSKVDISKMAICSRQQVDHNFVMAGARYDLDAFS